MSVCREEERKRREKERKVGLGSAQLFADACKVSFLDESVLLNLGVKKLRLIKQVGAPLYCSFGRPLKVNEMVLVICVNVDQYFVFLKS
jgi:hypothetical protein